MWREKIYLVTASINPLDNLVSMLDREERLPDKIVVVDEGDEAVREHNKRVLGRYGIEVVFYGVREREEWFKRVYGSSYERYLSLIPERSHAETSFGFLLSYLEGADYIIEVDDDVYQDRDYRIVSDHIENLGRGPGQAFSSTSSWVNTIDFLDINTGRDERIFPRGHPYDPSVRRYEYRTRPIETECVLNMGLWTGSPDLDAVTILYHGGLDGVSRIRAERALYDRVVVDRGSFFAVCSMNTSFRRRLVPAFYQLYMRFMGIDRFDDIWSGIFAKRIADVLGDYFCIGRPVMRHEKRPRPVWRDLRAELEGMIINEVLWRIVAEAEITGRTYIDAYRELALYIEKRLDIFREEHHRRFMKTQVEKMILWTEAIDRVG